MRTHLSMLLAVIIGTIGSIIFIYLHLPLPWLLGAIVIISLAIRFKKIPIQKPNKNFTSPARVIIGVTIGGAFTPSILAEIHNYIYSIIFVIPYVITTALLGMFYYWKILGFDKKTAYFSSMPGGVIEMVLLGEEMKANVSKVTLVQSSRLLFIVLSLPFIIQYIFHIDLRGNQLISQSITSTNPNELFYLLIIGIIGAFIGGKLKLPAAYLMGPMIISVVAHATGIVSSKTPDELLKFAQIVFGTSIGFTFMGIKLKEVIKILVSTLGHFVMLVSVSALFIYLVYILVGFNPLSTLLAFSPGGQAEINLIAILVGANVPYITLHHILRLILVFNLAPLFARKYLKD